MKKVAIIGSGFKGMMDAWELSKNNDIQIDIFDSAKSFGGISQSHPILGFNVDMGVHMFDSIQKELYSELDIIMDGELSPVDFVSQSCFNNIVTDGFSLPDLNNASDQDKQKISQELTDPNFLDPATKDSPESLQDLFISRYGLTAGNIFSNVFQRIYSLDASRADPKALNRTSLGRLKFLDDQDMIKLKENPYLDQFLAARRSSLGTIDSYVSCYPSGGKGMGGFCSNIKSKLLNKNVNIHLNTSASPFVSNNTIASNC